MKKSKKHSGGSNTPPPVTPEAILRFIHSRNGRASKADIARALGIKGNDRIGLKHVLRDMLSKGELYQGSFRSYMTPEAAKREREEKNLQKLGKENTAGNKRQKENTAKPLSRNAAQDDDAPPVFLGLYQPLQNGGGLINPVSRQDKNPVMIPEGRQKNARKGDLVEAHYSARGWEITEVLAEPDDAGIVSLMAIRSLDIPHIFSEDVLEETKGMTVPALKTKSYTRTDLRSIPLVTIDGEDSRDFDDAVFAEPDDTPNNKDGWRIIVAIADVAHYVRPNSALDREAYKRGNSVYFPDRVVPMLPEALSNDLCSLRPNEDRACMAAIMRVDKFGILIDTQIVRGLMKSKARLTYTQVQEAIDGHPDATTKPLIKTVIEPLYEAYKLLLKARAERGTVELDLPERKIILKDGHVQDISLRARFDSHKLIEEMMILANVAVAKAFEKKKQEALYRVHPKPDAARWATTREFLHELGLKTKKGPHPKSSDLQDLLDQIEGRDEAPLVNDIVLRTMAQASYAPENVGHFGLALDHYAHFTSPIRRYADLIVHRALIRAFDLGDDGLTDYETKRLDIIGNHISDRERVAQSAERETVDRYVALFMEDKVGATFAARVSGVTRFGLFVNIQPYGADGLIPVRTLPQDFYIHDEKRHSLVGRRNGLTFRLAMSLTVRLLEVEAATGRLLMELVTDDMNLPKSVTRGSSGRRFDRNSSDRSNRRRSDMKQGQESRSGREGRKNRSFDTKPPRKGGKSGKPSGKPTGKPGRNGKKR